MSCDWPSNRPGQRLGVRSFIGTPCYWSTQRVSDFEHTGQPYTGLLPNIGFYYANREAAVLDDRPYPFAPDLAVEIASPSRTQEDLDAKARRYLAGGTSLVWVVWPEAGMVDVWRAGDRLRPSRTLSGADILDGKDVVGSFTYPIAGLFR
jgi:hypothetical protein